MRTRARLLLAVLATLLPTLAGLAACGWKGKAETASREMTTLPNEDSAAALQSGGLITWETLGTDSTEFMAIIDSLRAFRIELEEFFRDSAVWAALKAEVDSASPEEKAEMRRALILAEELLTTDSPAREAEILVILDSLENKWAPELKGVGGG